MMLEATQNIEHEDVTAGRTRVSGDHWLARRYPDCFREATDGPGDEVRVSTPTPRTVAHLRESGGASGHPRAHREAHACRSLRRMRFVAGHSKDSTPRSGSSLSPVAASVSFGRERKGFSIPSRVQPSAMPNGVSSARTPSTWRSLRRSPGSRGRSSRRSTRRGATPLHGTDDLTRARAGRDP